MIDNKNRPWILFEAGALAKGLSSNRVCTFLVDLKPADLEDPLAQFNHTLPDKESVWELVRTLNGCLGVSGLDERILEQVFATYWGQFETGFKSLIKQYPQAEKPEQRSEKNMLGEILENTRSLSHRIRSLETRIDHEPVREAIRTGIRPMRLPMEDAHRMISIMMDAGLNEELILREMREQPISPSTVRKLISLVSDNRNSEPSLTKP